VLTGALGLHLQLAELLRHTLAVAVELVMERLALVV
jgi:hypothetical protein